MIGFVTDIEQATKENDFFRKVIFTAGHSQYVLMALQPGEDIGMEVHATVDQFIRIEAGEGKAILDGVEHQIKDGSAIVVPAGTWHNFINTSAHDKMKLYTIYTPPNHPEMTVHRTKADAVAAHNAKHPHVVVAL